MSAEQIQSIEQDIKVSKASVDFGNALTRLQENKDFKQVVLDGYFKDEAVRLVHLKADPQFQTPVRQADILRQIDSIGTFSDFLASRRQMAGISAKSLKDSEEALVELNAEALNG